MSHHFSFFDDFFENRLVDRENISISPRINIEETDNEWLVTAELPGVTKDDVKVNFQDGLLTISGEKKSEKEDKNKNFHKVERSYGKFYRSLNVNSSVLADKIDASFKDGILEVTLPKAEEAKPKLIDVKIK